MIYFLNKLKTNICIQLFKHFQTRADKKNIFLVFERK